MEKSKFVLAPGVSWVNGKYVPEGEREKPISLTRDEAMQPLAMGQIVAYEAPKPRKPKQEPKVANSEAKA
jgi:hypothetical protein